MKNRAVICFWVGLLGAAILFEFLFQRHVAGESGNYVQNFARNNKDKKWMPYLKQMLQADNSAGFFPARPQSGVKEAWVSHYSSGLAPAYDVATAMTVDSAKAGGNVYVTGLSLHSETGYDFVTVKYNSVGMQEQVIQYNSPWNLDDEAVAIAVDSAGNIYVTGASVGSSTAYDYATVKYNRSGVQQWVARYNSPANSDDRPVAIALDRSGNVYVTGESLNGKFSDYATIKYSPAGAQQWVARYNGPGNEWDAAFALTVDESGNIYVTGRSNGSGSSADYATIKYNTSGVQQWIVRYNGSANDWDVAVDIALDRFGDVYVTGSTMNFGTFADYTTIKYNNNGVQQWITHYNSLKNFSEAATAIAVDRLGNVYVTGAEDVGPFQDLATIKYNSAGAQEWVARYSGPRYDEVTDLAIDATGNAYVTGLSEVSYLALDYLTIKYDSNGEQEWIALYNGPGNSRDRTSALAVDGAGNIYVTGRSEEPSSSTYSAWSFYSTIKYEQIPVAVFSSSRSAIDFATISVGASRTDSLMIANLGDLNLNIVSVESDQQEFHVTPASATISLNCSAAFRVTFQPASSGNKAGNLVFHHNGASSPDTVCLSGMAIQAALSVFPPSIKFGRVPIGFSRVDSIRITNSGNATLILDSVECNNPRFVVTPSMSMRASAGLRARALFKANSNHLSRRLNSTSTDSLKPREAKTYYVKFTPIDTTQQSGFIVLFHNAPSSSDTVQVTGHGDNSAFIAIPSILDFGDVQIDMIKQAKTKLFNTRTKSLTILQAQSTHTAFTVQPQGGVVESGTSMDFEVTFRPSEIGNYNAAIVFSHDAEGAPDTVLIHGRGIPGVPVGVSETDKPPAASFALYQNYPNPFNPSTKIRYAIPQPVHVSLKILNLLGHEVATLVNETKLAGEYEIEWNPIDLPSGVYVYRLHAGDFVETKKLILLQ